MGSLSGGVTLLYPPHWYYTSVPADLSYTAGFLKGHGVSVDARDLSAGLMAHLLPDSVKALQDPDIYTDWERHRAILSEMATRSGAISKHFAIEYGGRSDLRFPDIDEANVSSAWRVGLDTRRNPALPLLARTAQEVAEAGPAVVGIALVYPAQRVHAVVLGRLLRQAGYRGLVVLYGSLQDEIAPADFVDDLAGTPEHLLFRDFDGAIIGEAETALLQLASQGLSDDVPNLLSPKTGLQAPERFVEDLATHPLPDFSWVDPTLYCTPRPVVDLRLGRGCPYGLCAFCAIQQHHIGYRATSIERLVQGITRAQDRLQTRFFRIRDDLVTPHQLKALGAAIGAMSRDVRWSARARFQKGLSKNILQEAHAGGLEELWLGLESASPEVRSRMVKGVNQATVKRVVADGAEIGIRLRALCIVGFPGETAAQLETTVAFLTSNLDRLTAASISRFELMRKSPMAADPAAFGIHVRSDRTPRSARLRYTLPATWESPLSDPAARASLKRLHDKLMPRIEVEQCPDAAHGWLRASITKRPIA